MGAHGLVCVPSVPETLSQLVVLGGGARGDVIAPIKQGLGVCDSGSHAHLYPLQSDPRENTVCVFVIGCLCGCMKLGRWEKLLLRQMDHLHWLVLTGRYVSFSGGR